MSLDGSYSSKSVIAETIDCHPLTVTPDTPLADVIVLMSQTRGRECAFPNGQELPDTIQVREARSSSVLIVEDSKLLGIFTERDIVQLIAAGVQLQDLAIGEVMVHPVITLPQDDFQDIFAALFLFRRYRIRHLVLVDAAGLLVGVVTPESIRRVLHPANLLRIRRVADVMSTWVIEAPLTASVLSVARLMAQHRVSCVVMTDQSTESQSIPVGIVTERDIVQFQALELDLLKTESQRVMSTPLFLLNPEDSLWTAHQEMQRRYVQRLVVSWDWGRGLGIVTQTSLLRAFDPVEMYGVIETLQRTISDLESEKMEQQAKSRRP